MAITRIKGDSFRPIKNNVFVTEIEAGPSITHGGILIPDDNMTDRGIRDRWARVYAVGPEVDDLNVGEWVLVKHGRWTLGIDLELASETVRVWRVEYPESVLVATDVDPRLRLPTSFGR